MPGTPQLLDPTLRSFYVGAIDTLDAAGVPFLVGGAYALAHYAGIARDTKDFDVFVKRDDLDRALGALAASGCRTETAYAHWLGKAHGENGFVDVIFSSGNGVADVDEEWFAHAEPGEALDRPVLLCPAEETIWSKAFIMERERYDGADVAHLLHARAGMLDWPRLLRRFGAHWRVLLSHLVMFGFVYPSERNRIPAAVMGELTDRLRVELASEPLGYRLCNGTMISRTQYLVDLDDWGYADARQWPHGPMSESDVREWTQAARRDAAH